MSHVPEQLKGTEFEALLSDAATREEKLGVLTMDSYGVTLSVQNGVTRGIPSKPDCEGVFSNGHQFVFEAKVCSGPSFPLTKDKIKPRQVSFMLTRSRFNVPTFLVIHWNARNLVKSSHPAMTVAIPVTHADPRWQRFVDAHDAARRDKAAGGPGVVEPQGSISRDESLTIGKIVPWRLPKGCRKPTPDLLSFLSPQLAEEFPEFEP